MKDISSLSYFEILEFVIFSYSQKYGETKFKKVFEKVMTSNKISGLISTVKYNGLPPGSKDFLYCLNEIPFFIFSSNKTQALAAIIALQRWNEEVNSQEFLLSEDGLKLRALNVLKELDVSFF